MMPAAAAGGSIVLQATLGSLTELAHLWHPGRSHLGPEQHLPPLPQATGINKSTFQTSATPVALQEAFIDESLPSAAAHISWLIAQRVDAHRQIFHSCLSELFLHKHRHRHQIYIEFIHLQQSMNASFFFPFDCCYSIFSFIVTGGKMENTRVAVAQFSFVIVTYIRNMPSRLKQSAVCQIEMGNRCMMSLYLMARAQSDPLVTTPHVTETIKARMAQF